MWSGNVQIMTDNSNERIHGRGIMLAIPIGITAWAVAYAVNGWYGVGVVLGVSLLVIVALALDDRYYENDGE